MNALHNRDINILMVKRQKDIIRINATAHFIDVLKQRSIDLSLISEMSKKVNNLKIGEKTAIIINNTVFFVCRTSYQVVKIITAYKMTDRQMARYTNK